MTRPLSASAAMVSTAGALLELTWMTAVPAQAGAPPGGGSTLVPAANGMELKAPDGRIVFDYLTKKPEDSPLTSPSAACFHPVNTPSGERVTAFAPDDHPHHRGMYIAWHDAEFRQP